MDYLPLFLDIRGRWCAVVGGDATAARKAELLLRAGARVRVIAPVLEPSMRALADEEKVSHLASAVHRSAFDPGLLDGCCLVVVALADADDARAVATAADARGLLVNAVDRPELCRFVMPAIVDRSPVVVAISTAGAAPVLGRFLRARLEALLPARLGALAALAGSLRPRVAEALDPASRRRFWEDVLQGPIAEQFLSGDETTARARILARLDATHGGAAGEIYLVAAPAHGDPERATLRAVRLLQQADLVLHDADLPAAVLDLVRRDAHREPVTTADGVAERLAESARAGRRVAWLGDCRWTADDTAARTLLAVEREGAAVLRA